jgi:hypothetical protein
MSPTLAGISASGNWESDGSIVADLPAAALTAGRLLLAATFVRAAGATINLPSASPGAWTLLSPDNYTGTNTTGEVARKVSAGGTETAPTLSSSVVASLGTGGIILALDGWSGVPTDVLIATDNGASSNLLAPAVPAAPDQSLVIRLYFNADNNTIVTPPPGTQVFTEIIATLGRMALHAYTSVQSGTGSTGTALLVSSASDGWQTATIVVPPSAGGAGDLVPAKATLAMTSTTPTLTQAVNGTLTVAKATVPMLAQNATLTVAGVGDLAPAKMTLAMRTTSPTLTLAASGTLAVSKATLPMLISSPTLSAALLVVTGIRLPVYTTHVTLTTDMPEPTREPIELTRTLAADGPLVATMANVREHR